MTTACVTIVIPPPAVPDAKDDTYTCPVYTACTINATVGLIQNDNTTRPGPITVTGNSPASNGTVTVYPNGSFEWTPPYS